MPAKPYSAREVAGMIGVSLDTLYRTRQQRETRDGMPAPQQLHPLMWERSGFDAWRTRNHPARGQGNSQVPANDVFAMPAPADDDEHRARLRVAYGSGASPCSSPARAARSSR